MAELIGGVDVLVLEHDELGVHFIEGLSCFVLLALRCRCVFRNGRVAIEHFKHLEDREGEFIEELCERDFVLQKDWTG